MKASSFQNCKQLIQFSHLCFGVLPYTLKGITKSLKQILSEERRLPIRVAINEVQALFKLGLNWNYKAFKLTTLVVNRVSTYFDPSLIRAKPSLSLLYCRTSLTHVIHKLITTLLVKSEDCYLCLKFEIPLDAVDGLEGLAVITCKRPYNDNLNCGFIRNL